MQYNKTNWVDNKTIINAERMNNIEEGIYQAYQQLSGNKETLNQLQESQEIINKNIYKGFCKEFTSNGEDIVVNNGLNGCLLGAKIEGKTVKENDMLKSTKAVITVNNKKYMFYNPVIEGKTYLMKAPKDTQDWVIDDISEERDFDKYDYKLNSPNGLHRVYDFKDKIDLQKREITTCTHYIKLDDILDNDYLNVNLYPKEETSVFTIKTDIPMDVESYNNSNHYLISNFFNMELPHLLLLNNDKELCSIGHNNGKIIIYLRVSIKNTGKTKEGFKDYYRGKGIHFIIGSHIPITRKLTDEEYKLHYGQRQQVELHKMKNGDQLEIKEDKAILTPNVAVYDNFKLYYSSSKVKETIYIYNIAFYPYDFPNNGQILCNKLKTITFNQDSFPEEEFIMYNGYGIYLGISKSKLKDSSAITARDYMLQNDFKIMIPYKDEVKEDFIIEDIPTMPTCENNTFSFGEEVKPSKASVSLPVNLENNFMQELEKQIAKLEYYQIINEV